MRSRIPANTYQWLRAEILGAFFNAVFLIALCLSIVLEAITRLIDPPEISNPKSILVVGCLGLASNFAGFFVLGGHGHSHGPEEHDHEDGVRDAEEGHNHKHKDHTHDQVPEPYHDDPDDVDETPGSVFPEAIVAKVNSKSSQRLKFSKADEEASTVKDNHSNLGRSMSKGSKRHGRHTSRSRFSNIDDLSIHPASFRQEIIAASRGPMDNTESGDSSDPEEAIYEDDREIAESPLISSAEEHNHTDENHYAHPTKPRHDSWHVTHNHNKPKKAAKGGHGHNHADMGMNAMILHVIGDALGNVGVIVSALVIWLTTWSGKYYADPAVSLFITLIILRSCIPLTTATAKILLQATPDHIDVNDIKEDIQNIPGVVSCHHVHIWQLSDTQLVASMHIQVSFPISEEGGEKYMELAKVIRRCLHAYEIHSVTLQPEFCLDRDHEHIDGPSVGFDGNDNVGRQKSRDDDSCLLECVDECDALGCCATPAQAQSSHGFSDHDEHSHSDHEGHNH